MEKLVGAILACGLACAFPFSLCAVQSFPAGAQGWEGASVVHGKNQWVVTTADGRDKLQIRLLPEGTGADEFLVVSNAQRALVIDAREVFRRGVQRLMCRGGSIDVEPIAGHGAVALVSWQGSPLYHIENLLEGHDVKGHHWWKTQKSEISERKRMFRLAYEVSDKVRALHWRFDINAPAKGEVNGPVCFHGARIGTREELVAPQVRTETPRRLAEGEPLNPISGTVIFRYRRQEAENNRAQVLFEIPGAKKGSGRVRLYWKKGALCFDRDDLNGTTDRIFGMESYIGTGWHWYSVTWDDSRTSFYIDGRSWPFGKIKDRYSPQMAALAEPRILEFDRENATYELPRIERTLKNLGGELDDLCIWTAPLGDVGVRTEYLKTVSATIESDEHYALAGCAKRITVRVSSPNGTSLKGKKPTLKDSAGHLIATGTVITSEEGGTSVINAPSLAEGDYVVGLEGAKEPYWVLSAGNPVSLPANGRIGLPGRMELLSTVNPIVIQDDPSRFRVVGTCRAGTLAGRSYLETGVNQGDRFAIRLALDPKTVIHCIEVDYPDDRTRTADMIVQRTRHPHGSHTLEVGYLCGGREMNPTGRMLTHRCLYWTDSDDVAAIFMTARKEEPAAVAEIRVYRIVDGGLPAAGVDDAPAIDGWGRHFGSYWEDPAMGYDFSTNAGWTSAADVSRLLNRKIALMKYCGQDTLVYPGAWYHGLVAHDLYNPRCHARHFLQAVYEKFDREGMFVIPTINQQTVDVDSEKVTRQTMSDGSLHETAIAIHDTGKPNWGGWHSTPPNFNILHPAVQAEFVRIVRALVSEGSSHPSFKGVCLHLSTINCLWFGSIASGYNDYAVECFTKETGIRVPGDRKNPLRGKAYAQFLKGEAYEPWVKWRCEKLTDFYVRLAKNLSDARPDLRLYINAMPNDGLEDPEFMRPDCALRALREAGVDPDMLAARIPNLILGKTLSPAGWRHRYRNARCSSEALEKAWRIPFDPSTYVQLEKTDYAWMNLHDDYWESPIGNGISGVKSLSCNWLEEMPWRVTTLNLSGDNAMRDYAAALAFNDVMAFSRGGFLIGVYGMECQLAKFARVFRALPAIRFKTIDSGNPAVTMRTQTFRGKHYVYTVNATSNEQCVRIPCGAKDIVTGAVVSETQLLGPYELKGFIVPKETTK